MFKAWKADDEALMAVITDLDVKQTKLHKMIPDVNEREVVYDIFRENMK
jgi:hypothetical protein